MSHVTHMNESCHTYEWVMSHIWMSPVTHMNESWNDACVWRDSFMCVKWLIHMCDMIHTFVWRDSFILDDKLRESSDIQSNHYTLIHMREMTYSYVWHDSFICAIWLIHMCDMTLWYIRDDSFIPHSYLMISFERVVPIIQ